MKKRIWLLLGVVIFIISCGKYSEANLKKDKALLKEVLKKCESGELKKEDKACSTAKKVQQDLANETWQANKKNVEQKLKKISEDAKKINFESNINSLPPKIFIERAKELGIPAEELKDSTVKLLKYSYTQTGKKIELDVKFDLENAKVKRTIEGRTYAIIPGDTTVTVDGQKQLLKAYTVVMEDLENKDTWYAFNLEPTFLSMVQKSYPDLKELDIMEIGK